MIIPGDDPVSKGVQRFEVFIGAGRRRDWPPEVKARLSRSAGLEKSRSTLSPGAMHWIRRRFMAGARS